MTYILLIGSTFKDFSIKIIFYTKKYFKSKERLKNVFVVVKSQFNVWFNQFFKTNQLNLK